MHAELNTNLRIIMEYLQIDIQKYQCYYIFDTNIRIKT